MWKQTKDMQYRLLSFYSCQQWHHLMWIRLSARAWTAPSRMSGLSSSNYSNSDTQPCSTVAACSLFLHTLSFFVHPLLETKCLQLNHFEEEGICESSWSCYRQNSKVSFDNLGLFSAGMLLPQTDPECDSIFIHPSGVLQLWVCNIIYQPLGCLPVMTLRLGVDGLHHWWSTSAQMCIA